MGAVSHNQTNINLGDGGVACCPPVLAVDTGVSITSFPPSPDFPYTFIFAARAASEIVAINILLVDLVPVITIFAGIGAPPVLNGPPVVTAGGGAGGMDLITFDFDTLVQSSPGLARVSIANACGCLAMFNMQLPPGA